MKEKIKSAPVLKGALMLAICLFFFMAIFWLTDTRISDVANAVEEAGMFSLLLVLGAMFGQLFIQSISWMVLLRGSEVRASFRTSTIAIFVGWVANFFTPSMYLGGEPIRAYVLSQDTGIPFGKALGSVLVNKFLEFSAFLFFIVCGTALAFCRFRPVLCKEVQIGVALSVLGMILFFLAALLSLALKKHFFCFACNLLVRCKIAPRFFEKNFPRVKEMEDSIIDAFYQNRIYTIASFFLMLLFEFLIFIRPWFFFICLGKSLHFGELSLLFLMIQLIQAMQFTPGGIGILEGGTVAILNAVDVLPAHAIVFATFCRLGDILIVSTGFFAGLHRGCK